MSRFRGSLIPDIDPVYDAGMSASALLNIGMASDQARMPKHFGLAIC
jgi:hypothetical protein